LARVGSGIQYDPVIRSLPPLKRKKPVFDLLPQSPAREPRILKLEITPGFPAELLDDSLLASLDSILLTLYPSATAPTDTPAFLSFLDRARVHDTPIVAITERAHAPTRLDAYASGRQLKRAGVVWSEDLTPEAAWVKTFLTHWIARHPRSFHETWSRPLSDELGQPG
jgi:L-asparaginase/Glu-tRNA(Gln) amidotransferase subunit D